MTTPRFLHAAVVLNNGQVLITGGATLVRAPGSASIQPHYRHFERRALHSGGANSSAGAVLPCRRRTGAGRHLARRHRTDRLARQPGGCGRNFVNVHHQAGPWHCDSSASGYRRPDLGNPVFWRCSRFSRLQPSELSGSERGCAGTGRPGPPDPSGASEQ